MTTPLMQVRNLSLGFSHYDPVRDETQVIDALTSLSFQIHAGETLALLGESGCGKSLTALALMRLLPPQACVQSGLVLLGGSNPGDRPEDLLRVSESRMRQIRGRQMAMIFQEPATSLNPVLRIEAQIAEVLRLHQPQLADFQREVRALLEQVGLPPSEKIARAYPFELSGGMKQRVMIAMALAGNPAMLIADEPTTALDVTLQAQILDLLQALQRQRQMGLLLITHDLAVVSNRADRVAVMYAGQIVESGRVADVLRQPSHPYTRALLAALPDKAASDQSLTQIPGRVPPLGAWPMTCRFAPRCALQEPHCLVEAPPWVLLSGTEALVTQHRALCWRVSESDQQNVLTEDAAREPAREPAPHPYASPDYAPTQPATPVLTVTDLSVRYKPVAAKWQRQMARWFGLSRPIAPPVVDEISFSVNAGETLAIVGESGCGKTTVARAILQLIPSESGRVLINGQTVLGGNAQSGSHWRRDIQMVFQDPFASLDPRQRIRHSLAEGPRALKLPAESYSREALVQLLDRVGLSPEALDRFPHEFSGGQRQRIAIARALAVSPKILVCDEPTSALDVSVQASILNLLKKLQAETGIATVFITHNFGVVRYLADRVLVMASGRVVEAGAVSSVLDAPQHPYTQSLLASVPILTA